MSLKRHVLQVVAIVTAVALVFGAFAGSASAKKPTKKQKAEIRKQLRKQVRKNPGAVKRKSFLKRAALVNFKLPVTIRLRNTCTTENGQNPAPNASPLVLSQGCHTQGTALNQRSIPTAKVNLGPSLGSRDVAIAGALAAVVEFQDTYDGGALGNVNIKILPGNKTLTTSSVPLLWNDDISAGRSDANFAKSLLNNGANGAPVGDLYGKLYKGAYDQATFGGASPATAAGIAAGYAGPAFTFGENADMGCNDWRTGNGNTGGIVPAGYNSLFYGLNYDLGFGTGAGLPGYGVYTSTGSPNGVWLPVKAAPSVNNPDNIQAGGVTGNNDWIGTNPNPFPSGSAPTSPMGYNARDTVLRTNALSLGIAPGGVSVNMSTGTPTTAGGLTTAQGSQDVTLGYSGGQANLFGNIPGKSVGIDVTVNLETKINSIVRILDQDVFKSPSLIEGEDYPAGIFNCAQIFTGAVQNYIPGVRLTGSLRIAPAITKDGKVRIAKATVQSDVNNPDRVALSACLFPAKPFNEYGPGSTDTSAKKIPTVGGVSAGGALVNYGTAGGLLALAGNTSLPVDDVRRYPNLAEGTGPSTTPCNADTVPQLADIIRKSGLTGTVSGLPTPTDPAYAGVTYNGSQASVAGDITVNPIDVDVLLGDQKTGT